MENLEPQPRWHNPEELLGLYQLDKKQIQLIRNTAPTMLPQVNLLLDTFYEWMHEDPKMVGYFRDEEAIVHTKKMQKIYWETFFMADINDAYINDRRKVGEVHAQINLPITLYLSGANLLYGLIKEEMNSASDNMPDQSWHQAMTKLLHMDAAIVCQAFTDRRDSIIAEQSHTVMKMSTPVTEIWEGVLLLPVVGTVDGRRSEIIMNTVLNSISTLNAREFILDISGVGVVDTSVANYLIRIIKAASIMGCKSTISGISPAIAQTIVHLGIDIESIHTTATMMDALSNAFSDLGIQIKATS
jgi:rsbT co-antagonist protein RsbR